MRERNSTRGNLRGVASEEACVKAVGDDCNLLVFVLKTRGIFHHCSKTAFSGDVSARRGICQRACLVGCRERSTTHSFFTLRRAPFGRSRTFARDGLHHRLRRVPSGAWTLIVSRNPRVSRRVARGHLIVRSSRLAPFTSLRPRPAHADLPVRKSPSPHRRRPSARQPPRAAPPSQAPRSGASILDTPLIVMGAN